MKSPSTRITLGYRIFFLLAGVALLTSAPGGWILYKGADRSLRQEIREQLVKVAATAALQVDASAHSHIRTPSDESSLEYKKIKAVLQGIRKANPDIRYVYTMRKTKKPGIYDFVVDAEEDRSLMSHVGDDYDARQIPEMAKGFSVPTSDDAPTTDKWGTWLSGYAPIRRPNGTVEGIIGMDLSLRKLAEHQRQLRVAACWKIIIALSVAILLSLAVTHYALKPIRILTQAADKVRAGDLDVTIAMTGSEELRAVGDTFNQMVVSLKQSRDRMMEQSTHDFLTGLYNHRHFYERLTSEVGRAERYGGSVSVLILDIDNLKAINDTYGHPVGDSILRQVAQAILQEIRPMDIAARYGGDEFAIIAPETGAEASVVFAERVRERVESTTFYATQLDETSQGSIPDRAAEVAATVTVGVATFPKHHDEWDGLVLAAELALSRAKCTGVNIVAGYEDAVHEDEKFDSKRLYQMLHDPNAAAVQSLVAAVDARDRYTHGHSERVTKYALQLGDALGVETQIREELRMAGLLHDLGKIGVPDTILNKPGRLTVEEEATIRRHPSVGGNILRRAPQLDGIIPGVLFHHERWDGCGYPEGLAGEQIPLMARILAIADSYDAMTSDRPYRKAMTSQAALEEVETNAGKQFDPYLARVFVDAFRTTKQLAA